MNLNFLKIRSLAWLVAWMWCLTCSVAVRADDWPQWRGSNRDGIWRESGILESFPAGGLKIHWRARVGLGYSGPVVAQGRVFVTDHVLRPTEVERVVCFEESTGKQLWVSSYPVDYADMEYGNGPRASPTVHEGKVFTLGTQNHLHCLDAASGSVIWKKDLVKEYKARFPRYGASPAPVVEGELLIVAAGGQPDASVIAFDRNTGAERWKALPDRMSYSAPIVITSGGSRQAIVWTADHVNALEPATGKLLWQVPYKTTFDEAQVVASPVLRKDRLLCLTAWYRGSFLLKLDADKPGASVVWKTRSQPTTTFSTPVFLDERHFYMIDGGGNLCCIDATTGEEVWHSTEPAGGRGGTAHLTPHGDRVFLFDHQGHLILAKLTPQGYQEISRSLLIEPTAGYRAQGNLTWVHPAYANKNVYARNDRELVCASLAADSATETLPPQTTTKFRLLSEFKERTSSEVVAYSHDGRTLAVTAGYGLVKLLDLASGKELPAPARHKDWVCSVAFSPDDKLLVAAGGSEFRPARNGGTTTGEVKLWDMTTNAERGVFAGHTSKIFSAAFSPDGQSLATGSADQTVRLWDVATLKERAVLKGHTDAIWSVAFSPDGKTLASAGADHSVKLWDVATLQERGSLQGHDEEILAVTFSPDGNTIATGSADWTVRLWNADTRETRGILKGHRGTVYSLAFSPDGKTLATGSADETVKLWNAETGQEQKRLSGHKSGVIALAFAPDQKTLASAGRDDPVRLWEFTPNQP